jgi:hypothetical protein
MEIEILVPGRYVLSLMQQAMSIPTCQIFVLLLRDVFGPSLTSQTTPSLILANSYVEATVSFASSHNESKQNSYRRRK